MKDLTHLELALMGLLCERPMHPYEIEKTITARSMRDWTDISMSSVYKLLRTLEKDGSVRSCVRVSKGNRAQKVYEVTAAGRKAAQVAVRNLLSKWSRPLWPLDLALANLNLLTPVDVDHALRRYDESLNQSIACYTALQAYLADHCPLGNLQLAERPLQLLAAEKKWAATFRRQYAQNSKKRKAPAPTQA